MATLGIIQHKRACFRMKEHIHITLMHWELVQNLIQRLWLFKSDHQTNQQRRREKEQYIPDNCTFTSAFAFLAIAQVNTVFYI